MMHNHTIEFRKPIFTKIASNYYLKHAIHNNYILASIQKRIRAMHINIVNTFPNPCLHFSKTNRLVNKAHHIVTQSNHMLYNNIHFYLLTFFPSTWANRFITMKIKEQLLTEICYIRPTALQHEHISKHLHEQHCLLLSRKATDITDLNDFISAYCPKKWANTYFALTRTMM